MGPFTAIRLTALGTISVQQSCHPDRSVAQWRDLLFTCSPHASACCVAAKFAAILAVQNELATEAVVEAVRLTPPPTCLDVLSGGKPGARNRG
jgi:hypothetical protein